MACLDKLQQDEIRAKILAEENIEFSGFGIINGGTIGTDVCLKYGTHYSDEQVLFRS